MSAAPTSSSGGISLASVLTIVFFVLKVTKVIDWSWWWVFSPLWISAGVTVLIFGAVMAVVGVVFLFAYLGSK